MMHIKNTRQTQNRLSAQSIFSFGRCEFCWEAIVANDNNKSKNTRQAVTRVQAYNEDDIPAQCLDTPIVLHVRDLVIIDCYFRKLRCKDRQKRLLFQTIP